MQFGTVVFYNQDKGFGWIKPDDGGEDVLAHFSQIMNQDGFRMLEVNQRVSFTKTTSERGFAADNIKVIG